MFGSMHKKFLSIVLSASMISVPSLSIGQQADLPNFTDIVRVLQAQEVTGGTVLAWNHMAAESNGLETAPGRVGNTEFERSVFDLVGVTIKRESPIAEGTSQEMISSIERWTQEAQRNGRRVRVLEVELDAHGGAGRAAYLKVPTANGGETRVNIKGIGITGVGNADGQNPGPPAGQWASHSDGGAMLAEGLREYINGMMSHNELKYGGSRVIGVLGINQEIRLSGGEMDSLVVIVREPWRRMDRAMDSRDYTEFSRIPMALGQANAKRIMKGDFVNQSNMGFDGGFIDYGLIAFVNGFVPAKNYLDVEMHDEMNYLFGTNKSAKGVYQYAKGFYLLNQLGFEEPRIQRMADAHTDSTERFINLSEAFRTLIRGENETTRIDWDQWSRSKVEGNFRAQQLFRTLLSDILLHQDPNTAVDMVTAKAARFVHRRSRKFERNARAFARELVPLVNRVAQVEPIADRAAFAATIRRVAEFKNRDLWELSKQPMWEQLTEIGGRFRASRNQSAVQTSLDDVINRNQISTGHFTTSEMSVTADARNTFIDLQARRLADGRHGLKLYPELPLAGAGDPYNFEISFDGGRTRSTLQGHPVETETGLHYRIEVPHGAHPVTTEPLAIKPYVSQTAQPTVTIKGPPLFLNERMGLMTDLIQVKSAMLTKYGVRVGPMKNPVRSAKPRGGNTCRVVFGTAG